VRPRLEFSLRSAVILSLAAHLAAVLIPMDRLGVSGDGALDRSPYGFVVSLFEAPRAQGPVLRPAPPAAETPPEEQPASSDQEPAAETAPTEVPDASRPQSAAPQSTSAAAGPSGSASKAGGAAAGDAPDGGPGAGGDAVLYRPPRLLAGALPIDPEESGKLEVPDEIPVRLRVGADGRVLEIVPENLDLSAPVREALERSAAVMRFAPARRGARAVEGWFSMTFVFRR
jgi:protein TonB